MDFWDDFNGTLSAYSFYNVAGFSAYRYWYIENGILRPQNAVANRPGFIISNTLANPSNFSISAKHWYLDQYNGADNAIVWKFQDNQRFHAIKANPGYSDERGLYFARDNTNEWWGQSQAVSQGDVRIILYRASDGLPIDSEVYPNKTVLPSNGTIVIDTIDGKNYSIKWYNINNALIVSGTHYDATYQNVSGRVGFFHSKKWNANIYGWDSFGFNEISGVNVPPVIEYFNSDDYIITSGETTNLTWNILSGTGINYSWIDNDIGNVSLSGDVEVSPTVNTTYLLSAWNTHGYDYKTLDIFVIPVSATPPDVYLFSAVSPIQYNSSSTIEWKTSGCVSAFIDNGVGWVESIDVSAGTVDVFNITSDREYIISGFDDLGNFDTETTNIVVVSNPNIIYLSSTNSIVCPSANYEIVWKTENATSVHIWDGVTTTVSSGIVDEGSYVTSSNLPTIHSMSAYNDFGVVVTKTWLQDIYHLPPVAIPGDDFVVTATSSPLLVTLNGHASYDHYDLPLSYLWTYESFQIPTTVFGIDLTQGVHDFTLTVSNSCMQSASDDITVVVMIRPTAVASATPSIVNKNETFIIDGSDSYHPNGISSYLWELDGVYVSSGVSAIESQTDIGDYEYKLTVYETSGLSHSTTVVVHVGGIYTPIANAGEDTLYCRPFDADTVDLILDGTESLNPDSGMIMWYEWELSAIGHPNVSAFTSDPAEIYNVISGVSGLGDFGITLTLSASTGIFDTDSVNITISERPQAFADDISEYLPCDSSFLNINLSGDSDQVDCDYVWTFSDNVIEYGQHIERELSVGNYSVDLTVINNDNCISEAKTVNIEILPHWLLIKQFEFDPYFIYDLSATTLYWEISGAVSAFIDNDVGWVDELNISSGSLDVELDGVNLTYNISAFDEYGCMKTAGAYANVNSRSLNECVLKESYIKILSQEHIRWGKCRNINLVDMLPDNLYKTDTYTFISVFEDYWNNMYRGECGFELSSSIIDVVECASSSCLSAINNTYEHIQYESTTNEVNTPSTNVANIFVNNTCEIFKENISVLEKINRLTELFDPDLIPIELIQFYASNLGYDVGLSRENVGLDFSNTEDNIINQKKYLRFMIKNLPTWYEVKTTRNSVKMMLYSFGLVGDIVYYFTKNYLDPKTGIGLYTLEYGGQDVDNYGMRDNVYRHSNSNITYKELQKLKCNLSEWEKFKKNKNDFSNILIDINNGGKFDWILTDIDKTSTKEDISNIPNEYFSTPHFRLWFDIQESIVNGNLTIDLKRQKLISDAINAIKPINTVFEGVTGVYRTLVDIYHFPYTRIVKKITLFSDGYADYWHD